MLRWNMFAYEFSCGVEACYQLVYVALSLASNVNSNADSASHAYISSAV